MSDIISGYFPQLSALQREKFSSLRRIYNEWNSRINVISRKDMDDFELHHVLHSLAISNIISFLPGERVLDVGTGGGFPGIPLAIMFPETQFTLLDSIEKKIKVVSAVASELGLKNVVPARKRMEEETGKYDFIVSRAVTGFEALVGLTLKNLARGGKNSLKNGIIALKGGELRNEIGKYYDRVTVYKISDFISDTYFSEKMIVYLPA